MGFRMALPFLLAVFMAAGPHPSLAGGRMTEAELLAHAEKSAASKEVVMNFWRLMAHERKVEEAFRNWVGPEYIQHDQNIASGREATIADAKAFYAAVPGYTVEDKRILADGDLVAIHSLVKTTPQDRGIAFVDILRVENGRVVEHWSVQQPVPAERHPGNPYDMMGDAKPKR